MTTKPRNPLLAQAINKLYRAYWWVVRPTTRGVKALIQHKGKILLVRLTYYPNSWTFPGGGVNKKEEPLNAVMRECKEEVGITLNNPIFITTLDGADFYFVHM